MTRTRTRIALALAAAGLAAGGAVGFAQAQGDDPAAEREAYLEDAAGRLGVEPDALEDALRDAAIARVDAAVAAGRLSEEAGERLKERLRSGEFPLPGAGLGPHGHGLHHGPGFLDGAAEYLGLEQAELRERLRAGDSLAEIAEAEGKDVDGLKETMLADARTRLDEAVAEEKLTRERADAILERLESHLDELVERGFEGRGPRFGFGGPRFEFGGPPDRNAPEGGTSWGTTA